MRDTVYIIADAFGVLRMTKRAPGLNRSEVALKLTLSIPDESFRSAQFAASVDVPPDRVITPVIDVSADPIDTPEAAR